MKEVELPVCVLLCGCHNTAGIHAALYEGGVNNIGLVSFAHVYIRQQSNS